MIRYSVEKHAYAFPSKVVAGNGGEHILNIVLAADADQGELCKVGDYVAFDQFKYGANPADFAGKIVEQAADGNWYVLVEEPGDALFVCDVDAIAEDYNHAFTDPKNFFNPAGKTVRGYQLHKYDIVELSEEAFNGTPEAGKAVTYAGKKYVVGA